MLDVAKWKQEVAAFPHDNQGRHDAGSTTKLRCIHACGWRFIHRWNEETHGSLQVYPTILYSLRAASRGRVHRKGWTLEQQAAWLVEAEPMIRHLLRSESEEGADDLQATA